MGVRGKIRTSGYKHRRHRRHPVNRALRDLGIKKKMILLEDKIEQLEEEAELLEYETY